jgi:hypothetical protein
VFQVDNERHWVSFHLKTSRFISSIFSFIHSFIYHWLYSPLFGPGLSFSFVILHIRVGLLIRVIIPSLGLYLHIRQHKHRINAHTDIHALSGIRTHDHSVRASEDSSCLRPRGHRDLQQYILTNFIVNKGKVVIVQNLVLSHGEMWWTGVTAPLVFILQTIRDVCS